MLIDSRQLPQDAALQCDLCIVGGGAAGIAMALALAGTGLNVVVLESGGVNPDPATQDLYAGTNVGEPLLRNLLPTSLDATRLRYLGGSTNHWAGWCRPLAPVDFEARPYLPISGWPIAYDDLLPWYEEAQGVCVLGPFEYDPAEWPDAGRALVDTDRVTTELIQINNSVRLGEFYLEDLTRAGNVRVCLWGNAVELVTDASAGRVERIEVATLSGVRFSVAAGAVVLATGGIEVPRLLLASDQRRPEGLGNEHDLVGRHFTEHLQVPIAIAVLDRPQRHFSLYDERTFTNPVRPERSMSLKGVLSLTGAAIRDEELLGLDAQLYFGALRNAAPRQLSGVGAGSAAALLAASERRRAPTVAVLAAVGEQAPNPESRVTLSPTRRDALGMPEIVLDWRYGELDRRSMLSGLEIMAAELATLGLGRLQILPNGLSPRAGSDLSAPVSTLVTVDPSAVDPDGFSFGIGNHHMGTTRMDPDPAKGVVDVDGRVHSVENLYVAGSAVFPTGGVAPPTLTIVALALRLADHLSRTLR